MNPDVKTKWVAALRSGEYQQGNTVLRAGDRFCCLGVLCQLAVDAGVIDDPVPEGDHDVFRYDDATTAFLPSSVQAWADLDYWNPVVFGAHSTISELNDDGYTFEQIADLIEECL